jgi:hypothetical protein
MAIFGAAADEKPTETFKSTGWGFNSLTSSISRALSATFLGLAHSVAAEAAPATSSAQEPSALPQNWAPSQPAQNASSSSAQAASGGHNRPILPAYSVKSRRIGSQSAGANSLFNLRKDGHPSLGDDTRTASGNIEPTGLKRKRGDEATNTFSAPDDSDSDLSDVEKDAPFSVAHPGNKTTDKVASVQNRLQSVDKLSKRGVQLSAELKRAVARAADTDEERNVSTARAAKRVKLGEATYANATHEPARNAQPLKPAITYRAVEASADHSAPVDNVPPQQPPKRKVVFKRRYQPLAENSFGLTDDILDESDSDIEVDLNEKGLVPENVPGVDPEDISRMNERLQQQDPSRKKPGKGKTKQAGRQQPLPPPAPLRSGRRASSQTTDNDDDDSRPASSKASSSAKKNARVVASSKSAENKASTKPSVSRVASTTADEHIDDDDDDVVVVESESNNNSTNYNYNNNIFATAEAVARSGIRTLSAPLSAIDINSRVDQSGRAGKPKPDVADKAKPTTTTTTTTSAQQGAGPTAGVTGAGAVAVSGAISTTETTTTTTTTTTGPTVGLGSVPDATAAASITSLTPRTPLMTPATLLAAPAAGNNNNNTTTTTDPVKRARHLALKYKPARPSSLRTVSQISSSPPVPEPSSSSTANTKKPASSSSAPLQQRATVHKMTTTTTTTTKKRKKAATTATTTTVPLPVVVVRAVRSSATTPVYMLVRQQQQQQQQKKKTAAVEVAKLRKRAAAAVKAQGRQLGSLRAEYLAWKDKENRAPAIDVGMPN